MWNLVDAQTVLTSARSFYKQDGALKSSNKAYLSDNADKTAAATQLASAKNMTQEQALAKIDRRAVALQSASGQGEYADRKIGLTPVEYGQLAVDKKSRTGNCGMMACVAMCFANGLNPDPKEMWLVTAYNKWSSHPGLGYMDFGHSWALLGAEGAKQFVVDPWAGVACANADYEKELTDKLNKWATQGKRIVVNYKKGSFWTTANDKNILSLFGLMATTTKIRGDTKLK